MAADRNSWRTASSLVDMRARRIAPGASRNNWGVPICWVLYLLVYGALIAGFVWFVQ